MSASGSVSTTESVFLAWTRRLSYLGLTALFAACARPGPVAPEGSFRPSTREEFEREARSTLPRGREILRFRWRTDDGRISLSGSGAARLAPPDSLRVDLAATLGVGRSVLILAGDEVRADPAVVVDQILPDRPALWLALGVVQPTDALLVERLDDGARRFWRTTDRRQRVTTLEMRGDTLVRVFREEGGRIAQVLRLTRSRDGRLARTQLDDYARGVRFAMRFTAREPSGAFPDEIWRLGP